MMYRNLMMLTVLVIGLLVVTGCAGGVADQAQEFDEGQVATNDEVEGTGTEFEEESADEHDCDLEHDQLPFEWSGQVSFAADTYTLEFKESDDPSMCVVFMLEEGDLERSEVYAHHIWEAEMEPVEAGEHFEALIDYGYDLQLNAGETTFTFEIAEAGEYLLFAEHMPEEFDLKIYDAEGKEVFPEHEKVYEGHDHD